MDKLKENEVNIESRNLVEVKISFHEHLRSFST